MCTVSFHVPQVSKRWEGQNFFAYSAYEIIAPTLKTVAPPQPVGDFLLSVNARSFLQCSDTVVWETGRVSDPFA